MLECHSPSQTCGPFSIIEADPELRIRQPAGVRVLFAGGFSRLGRPIQVLRVDDHAGSAMVECLHHLSLV